MNKHFFYKNQRIIIEVEKASSLNLYSFLVAKIKGEDEAFVCHYGNLGKVKESPYVVMKRPEVIVEDKKSRDIYTLEKPWQLEYVRIGLFDKERARDGANGRFCEGSTKGKFEINIYNGLNSNHLIKVDGGLFYNFIVCGEIRNDDYSIVSRKIRKGAVMDRTELKESELIEFC